MKKGIGSFFAILLIAIFSILASFAIGAFLPMLVPHTHDFGEWTVVNDATCTQQGLKQRVCQCGEKETEVIPANGHNYEVVVIGSSCTTPGYTTYTCHCGDTYMSNHTSEQGHNEVEHAAQAPTCTEIGWDAYVTCSRCDYTTYKEIPALGHDYTEAVIEPSCTQQGYTSHTCSICNYSYNDAYIDAKGHTYEETVTPATCTSKGYTTYNCACGESYVGNYVDIVAHAYTAVETVATCTSKGYTTYTCSCGDSYVDNYVDALGHTVVTDAAVAATCTTTGLTEGAHCSICNQTLVEQTVVNALGHTVVTDAAVAATCTTTGLTEGSHCTVCNTVIVAQQTVVALGHDKVQHEGKAATCAEIGWAAYETCSRCDYTTYLEQPALDHVVVVDEAVAPTCTTIGLTEGSHCSVCKQIIVKQTVVDALGHTEEIDQAVAPTCTATGLTEGKHCSVCDVVLVAQQTVSATGHTNGAVVVENNVAPTCTEDGSYDNVVYCAVCGEEVSRNTVEVQALGHTEAIDAAVAPNCTTMGKTEGKHCSVCEEVLVPQQALAPLGHTLGAVVVENNVAPTCTQAGSYDNVVYCTVCDVELNRNTVVVPSSGHTHTAVVTAPTCTEQGYTTHTCTCGDTYVDSYVNALGHTEVIDEAVAPTCTATGLTEGKHCSVCDVVLEAQTVVNALGHTEVIDEAVAATCTTTGLTEGKHCSVCDVVLVAQTVVDALGHTEVIDAAVAAKCATMGKTEGKHCSVCNEVLVPQQAIAPLGHTLGAVVVENNVAPTCTEDGSYDNVVYCTVCDVELNRNTVVVPSTGHTHTAVVTAPTCTEQGYTTHTCTCGDTYVDSYEDALGHTEVIDAAVAATCTTTGLTEGKHCSVCDVVLEAQTVVDALGHTEVIDAAVAPKCTTMGKTEGKHCSVCNEVLVPQQAIASLGHTLGAVVVENNVAPTCTEDGSYDNVVYCTVCDVELNRNTVEVQALGHTEVIDEAVAPTCTTTGLTEGKHCSVCHVVLLAQETVDALGHTHTAVVTAPTCTEQGYTTHTCACGDTYIDTYVDALGHTEYTIPALAPTCTEDGHTQSKYCSVCETVLVARQIIPATGHDEVSHEAKAPNCTEYGWDEYVTCSKCDYTTYNQLSALGHDEVSHEAKAATCTEYGWDAYVTCSNCDYTTYKKINAKGHNTEYHYESDGCLTHYWYECSVCGVITSDDRYGSHWYGSDQVYIEPTCEQPGYTIYQCEYCDYSYTEEGEPAKGGTCQYDDGVIITATCEREGYTLYTCQICGGIRKENIVPPTQHILGHIQYSNEGSCNYDGSISYWCAVCYQTVTETIPAPGHDYEFMYKVDPTCTGSGYTVYKCKNCGSQTNKDYVNSLGHIPAGPPIFIEGSCTTSSYYLYRCSVCGYNYSEYLYDNDGHDFGEEHIIRNATCTTPGLKVSTCTTCGAEVQQSINNLPHNFVDIVVEPTCTTEGYSASKCLDCGYVQKDWSAPTLPRLDHEYIYHEGQEATCTTPGWSAYQTCGRDGCDLNTYKEMPINPDNHVFFDSEVCVHCGEVNMADHIVDTLDISATENDDVTAYVVKYKGIYELHIKGDGAMRDFSWDKPLHSYLDYDITKVYVDEGVTNIGAFIFDTVSFECSISSVTIAPSVKIIGERAFYYSDLRSVIFVDGSKCEEIGEGAFEGTSLLYVYIPNSVKIIRRSAYNLYSWARGVYIEENSQLTTLEDHALAIGTVDEFVVPASLCHIGGGALPQSRRYVVEQGNPYYMSIDGNLYTADGKTLIHYAVGLDDVHAVVPAGVTTIGPYALSFWQLKSVELPDTLVEIGEDAFWSASLSSITIPSSVEIIGDYAFCSCRDLTDIVIQGNPLIGRDAFRDTAFYEDSSRWENDMLYVGTCLVSTKPAQPVVTIKQGTTSLASESLIYHESTGAIQVNPTITTLIIPTSVTLIDHDFNSNCNNLDTIYYAGSEEQWNAIDIVDESDLDDITIYFNYTGE